MPSYMTDDEYAERVRRAYWHKAMGHRVRSWVIRLGITPLGDALVGKVWPRGPIAKRDELDRLRRLRRTHPGRNGAPDGLA